MQIRRASIYRFPERFIVCPVSTTTSGIGIASEPYVVLPRPMSFAELGKAISQALDNSHDGIPNPLSWRELVAPRLAAAGVKSDRAFQKQAALVSVIFSGTTMTFAPHRNGGATGSDKGFSPIDDSEVHVHLPTQEISGETALQTFDRCT